MGKRTRSQRLGRGTPSYTRSEIKFNPPICLKNGKVVDIVHDSRRNTPLAVLKSGNGNEYMIALKGMVTGSNINVVKKIKDVEVGSQISCIELYPGSGPVLCRSAGSFATLLSKSEKECIIQLPSKKTKSINPECKVALGVPAGSGFKNKPMVKAGKHYYKKRARGKLYPRTSGVAMNAVDHPFGGRTKPGKPKSVSRNAPPGKKVGSISPRRTGKKK